MLTPSLFKNKQYVLRTRNYNLVFNKTAFVNLFVVVHNNQIFT